MSDRELTPAEIDASVAKTLAEAEQARAAARRNESEAAHYDIMSEHAKSMVMQNKIDLLASKASLKIAEIERDQRVREEKTYLALDFNNQRYVFDSPIDDKHVAFCISHLTAISHSNPGAEIELILNSPGGDIVAGFALIDYLAELKLKGHKITTIALGVAASMAAVVFQAGDERVMGANSMLLIHEGSLGVGGSFGAVEDTMKMVEKMHKQIFEIFAARAIRINPRTTVAYLRKLAKRKDWWITAQESLELGLTDTVR